MGLAVTALVREMLVREGIEYARAVALSNEFDRRVAESDWLGLLDGTTFDLAWKPVAGTRGVHVGPPQAPWTDPPPAIR